MSDPKTTDHDLTQCPNWGQGGRYTYDPATGIRTPIADDESAMPAVPEAGEQPAAPIRKGK